MAYPQTLLDLQYDVLSRLQEAGNSTAGDLVTGTGAASTTSTATTITQYLNEASADLARDASLIYDSGTFTLPISTYTVGYGSLTMGDGNRIWGVRRVLWSGTPLTYARRSALENWYNTTFPTDTGPPVWWSDNGDSGILVYPVPTTQASLTVYGPTLPPQLINTALSITAATNATPIAITTASAHHLSTGQNVNIAGAIVNTAANGAFVVTVTGATTLTLNGSAGNGVYGGSGVLADVPGWFDPDQVKLIVFNAAARLALKNAEDASLSIRDMPWWNEWERGKEAQLSQSWSDDPFAAARLLPKPAAGT
jgi:hypothetical protein